MPADPTALAHDILQQVADAQRVAMLREDVELSIEQAAMILGGSGPLVEQQMANGRLPFRRVGSHHDVRLRDVLREHEHEQAQREALALLAADTEDLLATHGL